MLWALNLERYYRSVCRPPTLAPGACLATCPDHSQTSFGRHICLHRFKLWWLKPSHGESGLDVPPETAVLLAERQPSPTPDANTSSDARATIEARQYIALLPLSDTHARAALHRAGKKLPGGNPSALALSAETGDPSVPLPDKLAVLLVATGPDPFRIVRRLVREAKQRLKAQLGLQEGGAGGAGLAVAAFVDTFGWCTWDSFYTMVTPEGAVCDARELCRNRSEL